MLSSKRSQQEEAPTTITTITTTTIATTPFENFHFNLIEPRQNVLPLALIGGETGRKAKRERGRDGREGKGRQWI